MLRTFPLLLVTAAAAVSAGCSGPPPMTTTDPPAKLRLDRILEYYRRHLTDKKQPPADERAFKEYVRGLPADQRQGFGMPTEVDELFVGPRDGKPFVVRYRLTFSPGGASEAVAWEAAGENGRRFVALSVGYVEEYDDATFARLKTK